jgi:hypothetical protein
MALRIKAFAVLGLLALVGCQQKSEVTIGDTTTVSPVTNSPTAGTHETTTVVKHDTVVTAGTVDTIRPSIPKSAHNITVESPTPGQHVRGPDFVARGSARTFENSVSFKLLDATGATITSGHGVARGSMGHFGPYDFAIGTNGYTGSATLEVFDNSPKDGREIDKVVVPVRIGPDTVGIQSTDRLPTKK